MFVKRSTYDAVVLDGKRHAGSAMIAEARNNQLDGRLKACAVVIANSDTRIAWLEAELDSANARANEAQSRLARILAMETPGMANIGRKMIKAARGV